MTHIVRPSLTIVLGIVLLVAAAPAPRLEVLPDRAAASSTTEGHVYAPAVVHPASHFMPAAPPAIPAVEEREQHHRVPPGYASHDGWSSARPLSGGSAGWSVGESASADVALRYLLCTYRI